MHTPFVESHVLNGDSLAAIFPLSGKIRVMRECLIDGPLSPRPDEAFEQMRGQYLDEAYPSITLDYQSQVASEWHALGSELSQRVYFWFDRDVFCQVNFLFLLAYLHYQNQAETRSYYYIRPQAEEFTSMDGADFEAVMNEAVPIAPDYFAQAWVLWQALALGQYETLRQETKNIKGNHPSFRKALNWYADYYSQALGKNGLTQLEGELSRWKNGPGLEQMPLSQAFRLFTNRYPLAGLGDLQFFRLWDKL